MEIIKSSKQCAFYYIFILTIFFDKAKSNVCVKNRYA